MKAFKIIMNILGIIAASFLSIFLIASLVAIPVVSAGSSFFSGKNVYKLLVGLDYTDIVDSGLDNEEGTFINQVMDTDMAQEIIEMCADNIFSVMEGNENTVTEEDIKEVFMNHKDEFQDILKSYADDSIPLTEEILEEMTKEAMDEYAIVVANMMPTPEDIGIDSETLNFILNLRNGTYFWIVFAMAATLTVLVMLCQVMRFKGFMWIGVDYVLAALFSLVLSFWVKVIDLGRLIGEFGAEADLLATISDIISAEMLKVSGIMGVLGIVFIVVFIVGRKLMKK